MFHGRSGRNLWNGGFWTYQDGTKGDSFETAFAVQKRKRRVSDGAGAGCVGRARPCTSVLTAGDRDLRARRGAEIVADAIDDRQNHGFRIGVGIGHRRYDHDGSVRPRREVHRC